MSILQIFEPRMERAGLFAEEDSLMKALKELKDPKLSYKRSTRGYTLLYNSKPANPIIAGKLRDEVEKALHHVHAYYIKYMATRDLAKNGFKLLTTINSDKSFDIVFQHDKDSNKSIKISTHYDSWLVNLELNGYKSEETDFLSELQARIGKQLS
ncbi:hypothetical protein [Candidatus Hodarchaeum mangrovi]